MTLHHFTCLLHLPEVYREGITRGEIPIDPRIPYASIPMAANLTTNPDRDTQRRVWAGGSRLAFDKTRLRLTVEMPLHELLTYRQLRERFRIKSRFVKALAPVTERGHWFYAFAGVKPCQIVRYEMWTRVGGMYEEIAAELMPECAAEIEAERKRINFEQVGHIMRFDDANSWLLDNVEMAVAG
ncbi:MAG TPA: hypothetical protein VHY91_13635 [Pirellulales bacterium]|jgi:hypothetical protein|nr:hypothetical protein [Pirellulales bacterium]